MKDFSPAQAPVMTFFSTPFYRDLLRNGKGLGFIYLFLLLFVCWSMQSVKLYLMVQSGMNSKEVTTLVSQLPSMDCKNGKLSIDKDSPYAMTIEGKSIVVFDTSGKLTDPDQAGVPVLVTENGFVAKKESGDTQTVPWTQLKSDFSFNQADLKSLLGNVAPWLTGIAFVFGFFVWVGHLIMALLYGLFGLIMDEKKLGYTSMVRLASFAMTPAILISVLQNMIGFALPVYWLISIPMTLGFMYFGSRSVIKDDSPVSASDAPQS